MNERADTRAELHRILGPLDGLAIVVGGVIGAGILRTPGLIAGYLGDPLLILGVWLFGGISTALTAVLIGQYAVMLAGGHVSPRVVAAAVTVAFLLLHLRGIRAGRAFQNASTILKLGLLAN